MAEFIIDTQSVSWKEINTQLKQFLASKPDGTAWKDFYSCGVGTTLIELISAYATFSKRDLIANRRETYLRYAKNLSSVIGLAGNYGYSSYRGKNAHIRLKILPNQNKVIKKFDILGSVKNVDLISLKEYSLINGQLITLDCVVGNKLQSILTAENNSLQLFRFITQNVSEDFRIMIDNIEVPLSTDLSELLNDFWVSITNSFGGVDLTYLNQGSYTYNTLTDIVLDYIELNNLSFNFPSDVSFLYGTIQPLIANPLIDDTQFISFYEPPEDIDSIRIKAPLRFETQKIIRGREDFKKTFRLLNPQFIDTNGFDVSPAKIELTYLKDDLLLLNNTEKQTYFDKLNSFANYGVWLYKISDPIKAQYSLTIELKAYSNGNTSNIYNDISEIFAFEHTPNSSINENTRVERRQKKLQTEIDLEQIEHELVNLEAIKIARIKVTTSVYQVNTFVNRGAFRTPIIPNQKIYECVKSGTTGASQPNFTTVEDDLTIEGLPFWSLNTSINVGDVYLPTINNNRAYICITAGNTSNLTEPAWSVVLNDTIPDGNVIWKCIDPLETSALIWKCLNQDVRKLKLNWNEYAILNYGSNVIWL